MGCGVCIGGGDYEAPEFYSEVDRIARKEHTCVECKRTILKGEQYSYITGKWDGDIRSYKTCLTCMEIGDVLSCNGGRGIGELWDDIRESVFPAMSYACIENLSIHAKHIMIDAWREYKKFPAAGLTAT